MSYSRFKDEDDDELDHGQNRPFFNPTASSSSSSGGGSGSGGSRFTIGVEDGGSPPSNEQQPLPASSQQGAFERDPFMFAPFPSTAMFSVGGAGINPNYSPLQQHDDNDSDTNDNDNDNSNDSSNDQHRSQHQQQGSDRPAFAPSSRSGSSPALANLVSTLSSSSNSLGRTRTPVSPSTSSAAGVGALSRSASIHADAASYDSAALARVSQLQASMEGSDVTNAFREDADEESARRTPQRRESQHDAGKSLGNGSGSNSGGGFYSDNQLVGTLTLDNDKRADDDDDDAKSKYKLYVEMEELRAETNEWTQKARWLKYEQLVDDQGDKWGKLHLSVLSIRALFELRAGLMTGTVLLDIPAKNIQDIVEVVVDTLALDYKLNEDQNQLISDTLYLSHGHRHKKVNRQLLDWIEHLNSRGRTSKFYEAFKRSLRDKTDNVEDIELGSPMSNQINTGNTLDEGDPNAITLESAHILVAGVDFLPHTVMGFVRFYQGVSLGEVTQAPLGVRFLFIVLGPKRRTPDLIQIGRAMGALFSDEQSLDMLHNMHERENLILLVDNFIKRGTMVPGEWDRKLVIPPPRGTFESSSQVARIGTTAEPAMTTKEARPMAKAQLKRTGRIFGGLVNDVKNRLAFYKSDFLDGINSQSLGAVGFIFFVCYAAALTFGAIMGEKTGNQIGALEMVVATGFCGMFFSLFSGQPLLILGGTGPSLIITELIYNFSQDYDLEFLPFRFWIGFWVFVLCAVLVATDASYLVVYVTRFTEEIFGLLISLIFVIQSFQSLYKIYVQFPVSVVSTQTANVAVVATIYMFGTTMLAFALKFFGRSRYLTPSVRGTISNFGMLISIAIMVGVDNIAFKSVNTLYLSIPSSITPTCGGAVETNPIECGNFTRGWFVNPLGMEKDIPTYIPFAAILPAMFVTVLMFMEQQIAACITNRFKLVKPTGYHLDLLLIGFMVLACSLFGLPWMVAAAVRCMAHVNALTVMTKYTAPGEAPKVEYIIETRVTGLLIHALVPMSILLASALRLIPLAVLYGLFLYMGLSSMFNVQFIQRLSLLFKPASQHPDTPYVMHVPTRKMHYFTVIQFVSLGVLCAINYSPGALIFPLLVLLLVPLRRFLMPKYFSEQELNYLDN